MSVSSVWPARLSPSRRTGSPTSSTAPRWMNASARRSVGRPRRSSPAPASRQPWPERRAERAARDARADVQRFAAEHLAPILDELGEEGRKAAAAAVQAAFVGRADVEERTYEVLSLVRPSRPGDVRRTRAEALYNAAGALLLGGGESSPEVLADPRQPRHGQTVAEAEPVTA